MAREDVPGIAGWTRGESRCFFVGLWFRFVCAVVSGYVNWKAESLCTRLVGFYSGLNIWKISEVWRQAEVTW